MQSSFEVSIIETLECVVLLFSNLQLSSDRENS